MVKTIAVIFMTIICISGCSFDEKEKPSVTDMFYKAGSAYESGEYDKAIALYEKLRSGGIESGAVYYNLGNACLKNNQVGKAILNYTRAGRYIPRDSDLIANDRYAHTLMKQPDAKARLSQLSGETLRLFSIVNLKEAIGLFFIIYYLLTALIVCAVVTRRGRILIIAISLIVMAVLAITVIPVIDKIYFNERGAIAVDPIIDVKKEPYDEAPTGFPIYGGMKIYVLKEGLGWFKIERPDGRIGWVPSKGVEKIWQP